MLKHVLFVLLLPGAATATSPPDMKFPRNPGTPPNALPTSDCTNCGLSDFTRVDAHGYDTSTARLWWSFDPLGSARVVTKMTIQYGDTSRFEGPHSKGVQDSTCERIPRNRTELFRSNSDDDQFQGMEAWFAWGIFLGDSTLGLGEHYRCPTVGCQAPGGSDCDHWIHLGANNNDRALNSQLQQIHGEWGVPPGNQSRGCNGTPTWGAPWYQAVYEVDDVLSYQALDTSLERGRWHFFLEYIYFDTTTVKGQYKIWHRMNGRPDSSVAPTASWTNVRTLHRKPINGVSSSGPSIGVYKSYEAPRTWGYCDAPYPYPAHPEDFPHTIYFWGWGRSSTASRAMGLAGLPAPPVAVEPSLPPRAVPPEPGFYDLLGRRVEPSRPGVYFERRADGSVRRLVVR